MTSLNPLLALKTLAQNVVRAPEGAKCRLKYVIHSPGWSGWTLVEHTYAEQRNYASMISIS